MSSVPTLVTQLLSTSLCHCPQVSIPPQPASFLDTCASVVVGIWVPCFTAWLALWFRSINTEPLPLPVTFHLIFSFSFLSHPHFYNPGSRAIWAFVFLLKPCIFLSSYYLYSLTLLSSHILISLGIYKGLVPGTLSREKIATIVLPKCLRHEQRGERAFWIPKSFTPHSWVGGRGKLSRRSETLIVFAGSLRPLQMTGHTHH